MKEKIIVLNTAIYVNSRFSCLESRKKQVCVIDLESKQPSIHEQLKIFGKDINFPYNAIVLGDLNIDFYIMLDILQQFSDLKEIHLILPLSFQKITERAALYEQLSDLKKLKTLTIYDPYELAYKKYGNTETSSIEKIINKQTDHILKKLDELLIKIDYQPLGSKFFYDQDTDRYINTDSLDILDDYRITRTLGFLMPLNLLDRDKEENSYIIQQMKSVLPRPNGKQICEKLRSIRKEFAKLNNIEFEFKECSYNGPCGGTCTVCDQEAKKLNKLASKKDTIKYPQISLEEPL